MTPEPTDVTGPSGRARHRSHRRSGRAAVGPGARVAGMVALVLGTGIVAGGTLAAAIVAAGASDQEELSSGEAMLRSDIDALRDAGLPADDPKVTLLEEELAALRDLEDAAAVPEVGVDLGDVAVGGGSQSAEPDATEEWDEGVVECEPIPGHIAAVDVARATCTVERLADGTVRYLAVSADGTGHEAIFATDDLPASP